jgi:iron complex outermembrane recepter protein
MKRFIGCLGFIFLALQNQAQVAPAFSGGIVQDEKGRAIQGATIHVLNTEVYVISNDSGRFSIQGLPPGIYHLEIAAVGFARIEKQTQLPLNRGDMIHILMPVSAQQLDAVVVTAEKEESNIQTVPVSITALSSRDIDAYRLWSSKELKGIVSNMYAADPGDGRNVISIRGITSTSYDPAVVTYIDGVPQFTLDTYIPQLFDIDHIDVLKGPQGTLYGRNALGGVVNIVTKKPDNQFHASIDLSAGDHGLQRYSFQISAPLIDGKLFLGVAGLYEGSNGFYINDYNNSLFDKQHRFADNISLKYLPGAQWSFSLNLKNLWNRNQGAFPLNPTVESALSDPYHLDQNAIGEMVDNSLNASVQIRHTGTKMDFSSLTAYQSNYRYYATPVDGDFSPLDILSIVNNYGKPWNKVNAWTEELRLSSATASLSSWKWAVGSYLFLQKAPNKQGVHFGADAALAGSPDSNYTIINTTQIKNQGLAFYGQLQWEISKKFTAAGGLRYDYQQSNAEVSGVYLPDGATSGFPTQNDTSGKSSFYAWSPMASLTYHPNEHVHLYISYNRGYRTGGLTQLSTDPTQPPLYPYQPEFSNNYELGLKTNYFGNRLHGNFAVFYNTVQDVQVPTLILPDAITVIKNAGGLISRGFEAEMQALVIPGLDLTYHFGYTHATYTSGELSSNGNAIGLDGEKQVFTPDLTSMFSAQYNKALSGSVNGFVRMEWFYFGRQYFDLANLQEQSSYQLLNASVGASFKQFALTYWMRNITGTKYIAYAYDFGAARLGDPFTFGFTLKYLFH